MKRLSFIGFFVFVVVVTLGFYTVCVSGIKQRCQYDVAMDVGCAKDSIPVNIQGRTITISEEVYAHVTSVSSVLGTENSMIHSTLYAPSIQKWSLKECETTYSVLASRTRVLEALRRTAMIPDDVIISM